VIGEKWAESLHQYDHGSFRIFAYITDWIAGDLRPRVHDQVEWVKIGDLGGYQLLPADVPIAASLQKM
jgi:8-oxo-dGTP diphosphatase